jgi:hypothetical protein
MTIAETQDPIPELPTLAEPQDQNQPGTEEPTLEESAAACIEKIRAALAEHGFDIAPVIGAPEPVGLDGSALLIRARWNLAPDPQRWPG